jgi:uncharacterized integral membrane protein
MAGAIRRFAFWIVLIPVSLLLIAFALANRSRVFLSLLPFDGGIELPLFLIFFLSLLAGCLLGGFMTWNSQRPWRQLARRQAREIDELRGDIDILKAGAPVPPRQDWQILPPL